MAVAFGAAPEDEPAAIFFAFSRDHAFLGEDYLALPMTLARNSAQENGLHLRASRFELVDQARAISAGLVPYKTIRSWFAERQERSISFEMNLLTRSIFIEIIHDAWRPPCPPTPPSRPSSAPASTASATSPSPSPKRPAA